MTEKYRVGEIHDNSQDKVIEGWENALDLAESIAGNCDEQVFIGIWLDEVCKLFAIYDGEDWFTK